MAGASIGKTSLVLGTQWAKLSAGLSSAYGEMKGFKSKVTGLFAGGVGGKATVSLGGLAAAEGQAKGFKGRIGAALNGIGLGKLAGPAAALGPLGAGLAATAAAAFSVTKAIDTIHDAAAQGAAAKAFGLSAEQFTGMAGVASSVGSDSREFIESLVTLGKVASEGAAGKGEVSTAWFKALNVDAKAFAALKPDEQFYQVFEALEKVQEPGERVRHLMTAFGEDGGKNLLPLLSKTSAEIRQMGASFAISGAEMAKMQKADAAVKQASAAVSKAWRQIVAAASPVIEALANGLTKLSPIFDWLGRAFGTYWGIIGAVIGVVIDQVAEAVQVLAGWAGELLDFGGEWPTIEQVITGVLRTVGVALAYVWDTLKAGVGVMAIVASFVVEGFAKIVEAFKGTIKDLLNLAGELPDRLGGNWFREQATKVDGFGARISKSAEQMRTWGKGTFTNFGKSADGVNAWFDTLGKTTVTPTIVPKVKGGNLGDGGGAKLSKALEAGSKDEYSARVRFELGGGAKDQLGEAKETNKTLKKIHGAIEAGSKGDYSTRTQFEVIP